MTAAKMKGSSRREGERGREREREREIRFRSNVAWRDFLRLPVGR